MFVLYNILQLVFVLVFLPIIILFVVTKGKYRNRIPARLGLGLARKVRAKGADNRRFWLHALSVGEVTSAVPLIEGLRRAYPGCTIIVSVTTRTGRRVADQLLGGIADHIVDGPIDLLPVVHHFIRCIHPDLFILVETDFWPNILACLKNRGVPTLLVNGRVSQQSMHGYLRMRPFFRAMFLNLSCLSMQTERDRDNMVQLGVEPGKLPILGNLKFATPALADTRSTPAKVRLLPPQRLIFIAGSTHPGEEHLLIDCYIEVRKLHPELYLVIAPRDPERTTEIRAIAAEHNLTVLLRSTDEYQPADMFILDTIGELVDFYGLADIAFVGGSLVKKGGHNPIEPAAMGIPVLFGPDMTDFSEIADSLIEEGGAIRVGNLDEMTKTLLNLLNSPEQRIGAGQKARHCVRRQSDIIARHIELIDKLL